MHTHATEDYRLSAGLWFAPGDGARSTDCSVNMCAVGRVVADTLNVAGINTRWSEEWKMARHRWGTANPINIIGPQ